MNSIRGYLAIKLTHLSKTQRWQSKSRSMSTVAGPFNFLNGKRVDPIQSTRSRLVTNPATGSILCQMPLSNKEDVDHAVSNAVAAFPSWSKMSGHLRGAVLIKAADIIDVCNFLKHIFY